MNDIQHVVPVGKILHIRLCQGEQSRSRTQTSLLHMNKSPGELNQALVEQTIGCVPIGQPELLENLVGLVEQLPIKALDKRYQVPGVVLIATSGSDQLADSLRFAAHHGKA